jgi:hypothetical protein
MATQRSDERRRQGAHPQGGQHRPSVGTSTKHGMTDDEHIERLRRAYAELGEEFDEPRARSMMATDMAPDTRPPSLLAAWKELLASTDIAF